MKPLGAGRVRRRRLAGVGLVLAVVLVGTVASVGASVAVQRGESRLATQSMDTYSSDVAAAISDEVDHYADALADVAAGIATHPDLTADEFAGLTAALQPTRLPGATSVVWIVPAYDNQLTAVQAFWRSRGSVGLTLYPTGTDLEHEYVVFGTSFNDVPVAPGRDLAQIPETADALGFARTTGTFTMSSAHVLAPDRALALNEQQMSFSLVRPVLGAVNAAGIQPLRGWISMGVHGGDFLNLTLQNQARGAVQVRLTDPAANTIIAEVTKGDRMTDPTLYRSHSLLVGQHNWHLNLWPTTGLRSANRWVGKLTLIAGLSITALLAALVALLISGRNRAMDKVDQVVTALRQDIQRREEVERELQRLAFHDQLTGLANRSLFYDRVGQALKSHARAGQHFAVFFIDLDGFKQVNDEMGHRAGDIVLCAVADRLRDCLRDGDTVARFGGDEFAVVTERLADPEDVHITAERIVDAIRQPIAIGNLQATVTASVGIALNRAGDDADDILREADVAMYTAKTNGKCRFVLASY